MTNTQSNPSHEGRGELKEEIAQTFYGTSYETLMIEQQKNVDATVLWHEQEIAEASLEAKIEMGVELRKSIISTSPFLDQILNPYITKQRQALKALRTKQEQPLRCGHTGQNWNGEGDCIKCARDKVLGEQPRKEE